MKNEVILKDKINIEDMIYEIRGKQVMLDSDLAKLYKCVNGTKSINLAVKRNIERFPNDIYFQLTSEESLRFQFETSNNKINNRGGRTYKIFAFTEEGAAMLATVLHTEIASKMSLKIIRAFVAMRKYISNNLIEQRYINNLVIKNDGRLSLLEESFNKLNEKQKVNTIFFKGQIYDAYSLLIKILKQAKKDIIIIDNYCDNNLLDILKEININVTIYSKYISEISIKKYKEQYKNVNIIKSNNYHDRFIIIDRKELYHLGASLKDLGKSCFGINKINDKEYLKQLLSKLT